VRVLCRCVPPPAQLTSEWWQIPAVVARHFVLKARRTRQLGLKRSPAMSLAEPGKRTSRHLATLGTGTVLPQYLLFDFISFIMK
jgi:hypothetical protein